MEMEIWRWRTPRQQDHRLREQAGRAFGRAGAGLGERWGGAVGAMLTWESAAMEGRWRINGRGAEAERCGEDGAVCLTSRGAAAQRWRAGSRVFVAVAAAAVGALAVRHGEGSIAS